jgi:aspartate beta-hydroxylase
MARLERFNRYVASLADPATNPNLSVYPGLRAQPFHDPRRFAIVPQLEAAFPHILRELADVEASEFHEESEPIARRGAWDVLILFERGRKNEEHCARAPVATSIVENGATVRTLAGLTYFSRLAAGTHIAPHRGPTNLRVRCHLALEVPQGDCALRVGEYVRTWEAGKCLVFEDRFEHEAWNRTAHARTILVVDLWHPDLRPEEIVALRGLHRFALAQARNLNRYWSANEAARGKKRDGYD